MKMFDQFAFIITNKRNEMRRKLLWTMNYARIFCLVGAGRDFVVSSWKYGNVRSSSSNTLTDEMNAEDEYLVFESIHDHFARIIERVTCFVLDVLPVNKRTRERNANDSQRLIPFCLRLLFPSVMTALSAETSHNGQLNRTWLDVPRRQHPENHRLQIPCQGSIHLNIFVEAHL